MSQSLKINAMNIFVNGRFINAEIISRTKDDTPSTLFDDSIISPES